MAGLFVAAAPEVMEDIVGIALPQIVGVMMFCFGAVGLYAVRMRQISTGCSMDWFGSDGSDAMDV